MLNIVYTCKYNKKMNEYNQARYAVSNMVRIGQEEQNSRTFKGMHQETQGFLQVLKRMR
jgi:hypothetical protein